MRTPARRTRLLTPFIAGALLALCAVIGEFPGSANAADRSDALIVQRFDRVLPSIKDRLGLSAHIRLVLVDHNNLVVSVQRDAGKRGSYELVAERRFILGLDENDFAAAIAHELGHVWIFSHRPYLQTERLANDVALKAVSRDQLLNLYEKLWKYMDVPGDTEIVLGSGISDPGPQE